MTAAIPYIIAGAQFASGVGKAYSQKQQYDAKAKNAIIKSRLDAVAYTREGTQALDNAMAAISATVARGYAGGVRALVPGQTKDLINTYNLRSGVTDFSTASDSASLALSGGKRQAADYRKAGRTALITGTLSAGVDAFTAGSQAASFGGSAEGAVGSE